MKTRVITLAALLSCLALLFSVGFADKAKKAPATKDAPSKAQLKETSEKEKTKPKATSVSEQPETKAQPVPEVKPAEPQPIRAQPVPHIQPVEVPQPEAQPAPVFWEKGRNIKWQCFSAGGAVASWSKGHQVRQTVSQTATGCVSSGSHQASQGFQIGACGGEEFTRGDANNDGLIDLGDAIYILNYLFKNGPDPIPMEAGDANCDGLVDLGDAIYVLNYLFKNGPTPGCYF